MKHILLIGLLLSANFSHSKEMGVIVHENCQTNVLHTWEGEFRVCEVSSLLTNDLFICTYTNANCEGTLVEIYSCNSNKLDRVFQSNRNLKGVTPIILQVGLITNSVGCTMWGLWRHPGNGGNMQYTVYEYSNFDMRMLSAYEYSEINGAHSWFCVGEDDELGPVTNLNFSANMPLWTNLKTRYRMVQ